MKQLTLKMVGGFRWEKPGTLEYKLPDQHACDPIAAEQFAAIITEVKGHLSEGQGFFSADCPEIFV